MNTNTILKELIFKATRSSGAGGQHVNKVSSRIELQFYIDQSSSFSEEEKQLLIEKLASKITKENVLMIACEETRSQHRNKEIAVEKFLKIIADGLSRPRKRRPTKPSIAAQRKRVEGKKKTAVKKVLRKKPKMD